MALLIAGLVLFLGVHLVPAMPPVRAKWAGALGDRRYKGVFSLVSIAGFALLVAGYIAATPGPQLFAPSVGAQHAAPLVVTIAFILLAASHMRGRIRRTLHHPMVIGVVLWAAIHLLANGDLRSTILFGSFLAWSVLDLLASFARGDAPAFDPVPRHDVIAVMGGIVVAVVVMLFHRLLFGVAAVGFSL